MPEIAVYSAQGEAGYGLRKGCAEGQKRKKVSEFSDHGAAPYSVCTPSVSACLRMAS